jgi:hypothetical protein
MARTTLCLFGLYSVVALLDHALYPDGKIPVLRTAWYHKSQATFGDVLAIVRQHFWGALSYSTPAHDPDLVEIPCADLSRLIQAVCYSHWDVQSRAMASGGMSRRTSRSSSAGVAGQSRRAATGNR